MSNRDTYMPSFEKKLETPPYCPKGCQTYDFRQRQRMRLIENDGYFCMKCKLHLDRPLDEPHPAAVAYEKEQLQKEVSKLQGKVEDLESKTNRQERLLKQLAEDLGYHYDNYCSMFYKLKKKSRKKKSKKK